jgi:hypothetical protein
MIHNLEDGMNEFEKDVVELVVGCNMPIEIVDNEIFKKFCSKYVHKYKMPSSSVLHKRIIPDYSKKVEASNFQPKTKKRDVKWSEIKIGDYSLREIHSLRWLFQNSFARINFFVKIFLNTQESNFNYLEKQDGENNYSLQDICFPTNGTYSKEKET